MKRALISVRSALLALCWCAAAHAGAKGPAIDSITLERDCNGCPSGSTLLLQADGSATLTQQGKARLGTADRVQQGRLAPGEFKRLARLLQARGFFDLQDSYADPLLQDGAWATITVQRGGRTKQVFRRENAGPPALQAIEQALDAARESVVFADTPQTR